MSKNLSLTHVFIKTTEKSDSVPLTVFKAMAVGLSALVSDRASDWCMRNGNTHTTVAQAPKSYPVRSIAFHEAVEPDHQLYAHGARTRIFDEKGKETFVTQPKDFIDKMLMKMENT